MLMTSETLSFLKSCMQTDVPSISLLNENYGMIYFGEAFMPFSPFFENFDAKIHQMIAGGLFNLWHSYETISIGCKRKIEGIGPHVLTMDHLQMGFKISLCPLVLSGFVFLIEVGILLCKHLIDNLIVWKVVTTYIKVKQKECEIRRNIKFIKLPIIRRSCKCPESPNPFEPPDRTLMT